MESVANDTATHLEVPLTPNARDPSVPHDIPVERLVIDLKREFPMTYRRAFKKGFWRGAFVCALALGSFAFYGELIEPMEAGRNKDAWTLLLISVNVAAFASWLARVAYYQLERTSYQYLVSGGNLYLSRGLITRETGSFPLSRITDIYLHRGWGDIFWGLSSLHISTPTTASGHFAYIHGLRIKDAEGLRARLERLIKQSDRDLEAIGDRVDSILALEEERSRKRA